MRQANYRLAVLALGLLFTCARPDAAEPLPDSEETPSTPVDVLKQKSQAFFDRPDLPVFDVEIGAAEYQRLLRSPKRYVPGKVLVCGRTFQDVGIRLKGTGTFQPVSLQPNLALNFNWKRPEQDLEGLTKIYLNNSRQDASLLCELVASGAFRDGGVPAPRITQARARLNGRDLGLCVVAEAVNRRFLKQHFPSADGNLYEGAFQDVRSGLEQDNGNRGDQSDLAGLVAAASEPDEAYRREALSRVLDVEEFLNFLAIEMIVANWDGYSLHQNNYRLYHDLISDRFAFIPHGLDNSIFESGLSLMPPRRSLLATALLARPEDQLAFRQRVARLLPKVFDPDKIKLRVADACRKMKQGASPGEIELIDRRAAVVQQRVAERVRHLRAELQNLRPFSPTFNDQGMATLIGWTPKPDWNGSPVERVTVRGKELLSVKETNGFCFGSWRLPVWLPPGRYRIEALVQTSEVSGLSSMTGSGAGVRALGTRRGSGLQGSQDWARVQHEFRVQEGCEWVELIAELRAYSGTALFDPDQLRLVRMAAKK